MRIDVLRTGKLTQPYNKYFLFTILGSNPIRSEKVPIPTFNCQSVFINTSTFYLEITKSMPIPHIILNIFVVLDDIT